MRTALLIAACATVGLAATTSALAEVQANLTISSRTPKAGEPWRWTVTAHDGTKPAHVRVRLQVLRRGIVVGCVRAATMSVCSGRAAGDALAFTGRRTGVLRWRSAPIGVPLTFQAVVLTEEGTVRLRAAVTVAPAR